MARAKTKLRTGQVFYAIDRDSGKNARGGPFKVRYAGDTCLTAVDRDGEARSFGYDKWRFERPKGKD